MRWLARIVRLLASLALIALCLTLVTIAIFRTAAAWRESKTPEVAAGDNGAFIDVAGQQFHYKGWGPETGRPLLLVHGTLAWAETFRDIAGPLGDSGYRVIALDLPPFGFSQRPANEDYSRPAQAKRILAFADALGLDRFALGVHSFGGGAAMEAAFSAPERVEGLILLDVALGLGTKHQGLPARWLLGMRAGREAVVASSFTNPMMTGYGLRDFIFDDSIVTDERIALYQRPLVVRDTTEAIASWLVTGLFANEDKSLSMDPRNYASFTSPVLIVWGRDDTVTPLAQGEDIAGALRNARLEVLDGVNHIPHVEKPAEVVRLVDGFLKSLPPHVEAGATVSLEKNDRLPIRQTCFRDSCL